MATKRLKRPRGPVERVKLIGDIATGQTKDAIDDGRHPAAAEFVRRGGQKGVGPERESCRLNSAGRLPEMPLIIVGKKLGLRGRAPTNRSA